MCKTKKELNELVAKYLKLTTEMKKMEGKLDVIKDDIEEYVRNKGQKGGKNGTTLIVFGDGYKVSLITVNKPVWDGDKLTALFGETSSEYKKISSFPRLDIR